MPKLNIKKLGEPYTQQPEKYTDPTYPFYVGSHSASWITTPNEIEKKLLLVNELIAKQCGVVPSEIRISGRFTEMPQLKSGRTRVEFVNKFTSQEIYRGTYYPSTTTPIKIVHDDANMAKALLALASARQQGFQERIQAAKREANERLRQAKLGGAIIGMMIITGALTDPCNQYDPVTEPYYCN